MSANPKPNKKRRYFAIVSGALLVAFMIDLGPFLMSGSKLRDALPKDPAVAGLMADLKDIEPCNAMMGEAGAYQAAWRECYLNTVPLARSVKGSFVDVMKAYGWLKGHPSDDAVRKRAAEQIEAGWAAYRQSEPTYVLMDDFERATNRSVTLRLLGQSFGGRSMRTLDGELLDKAEVAIVAPDLFNKQQARKATLAMAQ